MFHSLLYPTADPVILTKSEPSGFRDVNIDQILYPLLMEKKAFGLESVFYSPVRDLETVYYRQEILRDTGDAALCEIFDDLSVQLNDTVRELEDITADMQSMFEERWRDNYIVRGRLIDCVDKYCANVLSLRETLDARELNSAGMQGFSDYIRGYVDSDEFNEMRDRSRNLRALLKTVRYNMLIKSTSISVRKSEGEERYSDALLEMLEKFCQKNVVDSYIKVIPEVYISEKVEAGVLNLVAQEYKEIFGELDRFCNKYSNFVDETVMRAVREIQFYVCWHSFTAPLKDAGLAFCYPTMQREPGDVFARDSFDLALARSKRGAGIVTNDFELREPEKIIVITGPNQGGKTTFARMFAQTHYFASLGLYVPGSEARLFLCDKVLTHFGKQEDLEMLSGQLQDDLVRLKAVFDETTPNSILIINEIFTSTTLRDALALGSRMMDKLAMLNAPSLVITFLDELASHGPETVSMVCSVREDDPVTRTYKIHRKKPDGLAFAMYLANKRGMTYEQIVARVAK